MVMKIIRLLPMSGKHLVHYHVPYEQDHDQDHDQNDNDVMMQKQP